MANDDRARKVPQDPREWRPQEARRTRRAAEIRDPILEPCWRGVRVIAHFRAGGGEQDEPQLALIDEAGEEVSHVAPRAAAELGRAIMALEAVVDGILTTQATGDDIGTSVVPTAHVPASSMVVPQAPEVSHSPPRGHVPAGGEPAFVALDLLSIDGQRLLDLPLLERKRLLEGLFLQSELVRVSVYTRPPVRHWLSSWKSAGFRGLVMKAANSRYRPGGQTSEWALVERESQG